MFIRLLLLFTAVPLIELALLVEIGSRMGLTLTVALVIATGVLGAWLAKSQGLRAFERLQREIREGRMPTDALLDGVMIFVAGAVLLTPGLLTDLFGFFLLMPAGRGALRRVVADRFQRRFAPADPRVIVVDPDGGGR